MGKFLTSEEKLQAVNKATKEMKEATIAAHTANKELRQALKDAHRLVPEMVEAVVEKEVRRWLDANGSMLKADVRRELDENIKAWRERLHKL